MVVYRTLLEGLGGLERVAHLNPQTMDQETRDDDDDDDRGRGRDDDD